MTKLPVSPSGGGAGSTPPDQEKASLAVCRNVMAALGRPVDFLKVTARPITGDSYRVNVIAGADPASARIAHSFFVTADDRGNVTGSSPAIVKQY